MTEKTTPTEAELGIAVGALDRQAFDYAMRDQVGKADACLAVIRFLGRQARPLPVFDTELSKVRIAYHRVTFGVRKAIRDLNEPWQAPIATVLKRIEAALTDAAGDPVLFVPGPGIPDFTHGLTPPSPAAAPADTSDPLSLDAVISNLEAWNGEFSADLRGVATGDFRVTPSIVRDLGAAVSHLRAQAQALAVMRGAGYQVIHGLRRAAETRTDAAHKPLVTVLGRIESDLERAMGAGQFVTSSNPVPHYLLGMDGEPVVVSMVAEADALEKIREVIGKLVADKTSRIGASFAFTIGAWERLVAQFDALEATAKTVPDFAEVAPAAGSMTDTERAIRAELRIADVDGREMNRRLAMAFDQDGVRTFLEHIDRDREALRLVRSELAAVDPHAAEVFDPHAAKGEAAIRERVAEIYAALGQPDMRVPVTTHLANWELLLDELDRLRLQVHGKRPGGVFEPASVSPFEVSERETRELHLHLSRCGVTGLGAADIHDIAAGVLGRAMARIDNARSAESIPPLPTMETIQALRSYEAHFAKDANPDRQLVMGTAADLLQTERTKALRGEAQVPEVVEFGDITLTLHHMEPGIVGKLKAEAEKADPALVYKGADGRIIRLKGPVTFSMPDADKGAQFDLVPKPCGAPDIEGLPAWLYEHADVTDCNITAWVCRMAALELDKARENVVPTTVSVSSHVWNHLSRRMRIGGFSDNVDRKNKIIRAGRIAFEPHDFGKGAPGPAIGKNPGEQAGTGDYAADAKPLPHAVEEVDRYPEMDMTNGGGEDPYTLSVPPSTRMELAALDTASAVLARHAAELRARMQPRVQAATPTTEDPHISDGTGHVRRLREAQAEARATRCSRRECKANGTCQHMKPGMTRGHCYCPRFEGDGFKPPA